MKSLNICFVSREYAHPKMGSTGGIGVFVKQYTEQLALNGHKVNVFTFGYKKLNFKDNAVQVFQLKDLSKFNNALKSVYLKSHLPGYITLKLILAFINRAYRSLRFWAYTKRHKISIVEFHDYGGDVPFYYGKAIKVMRCHGSARTLHRAMGYVYRKVDDTFEGLAFKNYSKNVIGVSKYAAQTTQQAFNLSSTPKVMYNGVKCSEGIKSQNVDKNDGIITYSLYYFGSVRERKGIDVACKVFNNIHQTYPKATLHVIGHNNNDYWTTVSKKYLSKTSIKNTTYYGVIPHNEIASFLNKAHIMVFPSYGENFSIALLEAMALGKLVITSNIPAFQEIIKSGENGLMAHDEEDYINHIMAIFENRINANKITRQAQSEIANSFNLDLKIEENIKYYNALLSDNNGN